MKHVLFVCTGNTCRSSMAEGIFRDAVQKDEYLSSKVTVASAGVSAFEGDTASENSIEVLRSNWGIDISFHKARRVTGAELQKADLVLTMTRGHKEAVLAGFPWVKGKIFTLKEYVQDDSSHSRNEYNYGIDIVDPYGMPLNFYKRCGEEIKDVVDKLIVKLKNNI